MGYQSAVNKSISNNNIKLTADKIIKDLDELREEGKKSKRRWIWELMQNAKDVPNVNGKVSVDIILTPILFTFSHNGDPFTIDNLTGLVQQVSSKHSDNQDAKVTGKFGTGFITTHLLSDVVTINGILQEEENEARSFVLELDRSGSTSEDLIPSIERALLDLNDIDASPSFKSRSNYKFDRKEFDFDTKFSYPLTDDTLKTAQIGIEDLITTLPTALVFLESIKQVRIKDSIEGKQLLYRLERMEKINDEYKKVRIEIIDELEPLNNYFRCFIIKTKQDIQLLAECENKVEYSLIPPKKDEAPFIYRDFPLIGTEGFYFPFILNGEMLKPTERRDSIYLNGSGTNASHNRKILELAVEGSLDFVDFLISKKAKNLYGVCLSSLPKYGFDEDDDTEEWYTNAIQIKYRNELIKKQIVEKDGLLISLKEIRFPLSKDDYALELRELITNYLGEAKVPVIQDQESWTYYLGPKEEMSSWQIDLIYGIEELAKDVSGESNILEKSTLQNPIQWLNKFYDILTKQGEVDLHNQNKLVLNQYGHLKKLSELDFEEFSEEENVHLPDPFLNALKNLGIDWRTNLVHRALNLSTDGHKKKSMSDLNTAINLIFREVDFLKRENALEMLLEVHAIVTPNSKEDSLQRQLLDLACSLYSHAQETITEKLASAYNYEIVHRLLIQEINKGIEKQININNLSEVLAKSQDETIIWLDNYLKLLESKSDYSKFLKEGNIVPNRSKGLIFRNYDLLCNYGTEYQSLNNDLLLIYKKLSGKDYFDDLIADGIGITLPNTLNFEKLGNEVVNEVEKIEYGKSYESNREALLELIDWIEDESKLSSKYLSKLNTISGRLFYILTIENSDNRKDVMKILRNGDKLNKLAMIAENPAIFDQIQLLSELFPQGIPNKVMLFAKEEARSKKEFNNLLEVGTKVENLFIKVLENYTISSEREKVIHAGGGAYDIRIFNPDTEKSFYIELKSCRYNNTDPINIAVSQAKRAVKELENENFSIVIIERSVNNEMDDDYIKLNVKYFKNPGAFLDPITTNFTTIEGCSNTSNNVDLKMDFAEFKGSLDYEWVKCKIGNLGLEELLADIKKTLS